MTHRKPHFYKAPLLLIALLICAATLADSKVDIYETAQMSPEGRVSVTNIAGKVTAKGWDRSEVSLTGTMSEGIERLEFESNGRNVTIEVIYKGRGDRDHGWNWDNRGKNAQLELLMPLRADLEIETTSADIKIENHVGPQDIKSVSGDIEIALGEIEANVRSISGSIDARGRDVTIEAQLESVSGDVELVGFRGDLEAETVSGDIEVRKANIVDGEFESVSGDIDLRLKLASNGGLEIETVSGDVSLEFDGPVDARMKVDSHSGDIDDFFGAEAQRTSKHGPGRRLRATAGSGNAAVNISTLSGDVRNRTRD